MPGTGVEPVRGLAHWCLRAARRPIPPPGHFTLDFESFDNAARLSIKILERHQPMVTD